MSAEPPDAAPFRPDYPGVASVHPSPNHDERRDGRRPDIVILHYTGMESAAAALERLRDPAWKVSSHYLVLENGRVLQLVPESRRAWHAGAGAWAGSTDINTRSIGIEIVNGGHEHGLPPYPNPQIAAVGELTLDVAARWQIPPRRILAHSDIAPDRKEDPGEHFPWGLLHKLGVGHWVRPEPVTIGEDAQLNDAVPDLQRMLARYGYDLPETGRADARTASVVTAFQRHFRPERVDGIADRSTRETLRRLLAALDEAAE